MKRPFRLLVLLFAFLGGCRKQDTENTAVWTGSAGFKFHGVEIELPNNGKGVSEVSSDELEFQWDGKALMIRDNGDETVSVTTPLVTNRLIEKSLVIVIDSEGNVTTRASVKRGEDQKPQQDAP